MKHKVLFVALVGIFVLGLALLGHTESVDDAFKKAFPQIKYDSITPTDIKGVYEIVAGPNIGYFAPEPGYLIVGEIRDKNGNNITAKRRSEIAAARNQAILAKSKSLPLDKAVKVGTGKSTVIEFTDPDCPYCRTAAAFFKKKNDVTKYVFFFPLPSHPDAENKVKYVFCAQDKAKAYDEAMSGKLDDKKYQSCKKPEADDLLKQHKDLAMSLGISSTPLFIVNNKVVPGADIPKLEEALKQSK